MTEYTCFCCGEGTCRPLAVDGRKIHWSRTEDVAIPADMELPTCDHCGEYSMTTVDIDRLEMLPKVSRG